MPRYRVSLVELVSADTPEEAARMVEESLTLRYFEYDGLPVQGYHVEELSSGSVCVVEDGFAYSLSEWDEFFTDADAQPSAPAAPTAAQAPRYFVGHVKNSDVQSWLGKNQYEPLDYYTYHAVAATPYDRATARCGLPVITTHGLFLASKRHDGRDPYVCLSCIRCLCSDLGVYYSLGDSVSEAHLSQVSQLLTGLEAKLPTSSYSEGVAKWRASRPER